MWSVDHGQFSNKNESVLCCTVSMKAFTSVHMNTSDRHNDLNATRYELNVMSISTGIVADNISYCDEACDIVLLADSAIAGKNITHVNPIGK